MSPTVMDDGAGKSALRRSLRQRRAEQFAAERAAWEMSSALGEGGYLGEVTQLVSAGAQGMVAAYRSTGAEPPTEQLAAFLRTRGMRVVVPWAVTGSEATGPGSDRWMRWEACRADQFRPGPSARAPGATSRQPDRSDALSGHEVLAYEVTGHEVLGQAGVVIVPALAVGLDGTRLGQGGGWYDRALKRIRPACPVLAMVNPAEVLQPGAIPREPHDVPVNGALLPSGIVWLTER